MDTCRVKMRKKEMRIFHVDFAKLGNDYIGGGETVMIEFIKYLVSRKIQSIILTTDNGKEIYSKLGLIEGRYLLYKTIDTFNFELRHHKFISYIQKTKKAIDLIRKLNFKERDKIISYNEFFPNSIAMHFLSKKYKKIPIFFWIHMISPNIFKGFEGEFINRLQFPKPKVINYKLNQLLAIKLLPKKGKFILNDPYYWKFFGKYLPHKKVYVIKNFGWADPGKFAKTKKEYDLVWAGRFHEQKGLFEIVDILKRAREKKKDVRLLLLGDGNKKIKKKLFEMIEKNNLNKNIDYRGFIIGKEKDKLIGKSKIFMMTSYYEGLPLTISEVTNLGVPIIAYDLPVFDVAEKGMTRVKIKDNKEFSEEITRLLNEEDYYKLKVKETKDYAKTHNKKVAGKEIFDNIILKS